MGSTNGYEINYYFFWSTQTYNFPSFCLQILCLLFILCIHIIVMLKIKQLLKILLLSTLKWIIMDYNLLFRNLTVSPTKLNILPVCNLWSTQLSVQYACVQWNVDKALNKECIHTEVRLIVVKRLWSKYNAIYGWKSWTACFDSCGSLTNPKKLNVPLILNTPRKNFQRN